MILQASTPAFLRIQRHGDTRLASGTVYPALRRRSAMALIRPSGKDQSIADAELRPPRKYYGSPRQAPPRLRRAPGYPLIERLLPVEEPDGMRQPEFFRHCGSAL